MLGFSEIVSLNQIERDVWVQAAIKKYFDKPGVVLDIGAGTSPYREHLGSHKYVAHDFGEYSGVKLGGGVDYATLDIKSDVLSIPLETETVDYVLCTEVLEHVPEPLGALQEISRLLRHGGRAVITAPFTSGRHQAPFHFYSGFSEFFYKLAEERYNFKLIELTSHGGYLRLLAQEICRVTGYYSALEKVGFKSSVADINGVFLNIANELLSLDRSIKDDFMTIGYWVVYEKK